MPLHPVAAFNQLTTEPVRFLKTYPLKITGAMGASGVSQYLLGARGPSQRPGRFMGTHNWKTTESFNIRPDNVVARAYLPGAHQFGAHSIQMNVGTPALTFYQLPAAGGPNIMLTGQLSGCSFVILPPAGGNLNVAHVQPVTRDASMTLRNNLAAAYHGGFVYGIRNARGFYKSKIHEVAVVGVRSAGSWRIFAQKQENGKDNRILSVWQIHPGHVKV